MADDDFIVVVCEGRAGRDASAEARGAARRKWQQSQKQNCNCCKYLPPGAGGHDARWRTHKCHER